MIWELSQDASGEYSLLALIKSELTTADYVMGDVNADGEFNIADAVMLQSWLLGSKEINNAKAGDICSDGILDIFDLCAMKNSLAKGKVA